MLRKLRGCTLFITGASRGIGKAIALKAAKDGANIVIAAKTGVPHRTLPGTIYTAAEESKDDGHMGGISADFQDALTFRSHGAFPGATLLGLSFHWFILNNLFSRFC